MPINASVISSFDEPEKLEQLEEPEKLYRKTFDTADSILPSQQYSHPRLRVSASLKLLQKKTQKYNFLCLL